MPVSKVHVISESEISVQGHGVHTAYVEMVRALKKVPNIKVTTGDYYSWTPVDVTHIHTVGLRTLPRLFQPGVKKVVSAHIIPDSLVGSLKGARYWKGLAHIYLKWFYNRADLVIAVSPETARALQDMKVSSPIDVIYSAIDTSVYRSVSTSEVKKLRKKLNIADGVKVVMGSGQVQPRKRIDMFLDVARTMPDVHFIWVGGIPFKQLGAEYKTMKRIMDESPANVTFTDVVPLEDMPVYYSMSDLFFLPSDQETFGLVVVEAAAANKPVFLRDIPDYADTFAPYAEFGNTAEDFSQKIKEILTDPEQYKKAVENSKAIARKYDSQTAVKTLLEAYDKLCQNEEL